jgi:hypothetical protein
MLHHLGNATYHTQHSTCAALRRKQSLGMTHTASTRRQFPWRSSKLSTRAGDQSVSQSVSQ